MINLQGSYADYQRSKFRALAKRKLKSAKQRKYSYAKIDAVAAIDQIMEINGSRPERSTGPMPPLYFNRSEFEVILGEIGNAHVVKCPAGKIVAYALVSNLGDLWLVDYVLGHGDHLNAGVMRRLDELFTQWPFLGSRRLAQMLREEGHRINRKRVQRLMRQMGIAALGPKPRTSKPAPGHKVYPYLLRDLVIDRPNQVWAADITYIPIGRGFLYLVAIMDWASRAVLSWRLSNTMDNSFCVEALEEALARFGKPEIFNTDQGSQFTSGATSSAC
jgi:putative transposase